MATTTRSTSQQVYDYLTARTSWPTVAEVESYFVRRLPPAEAARRFLVIAGFGQPEGVVIRNPVRPPPFGHLVTETRHLVALSSVS